MMGLSQAVFALPGKSVDILSTGIERVEPEEGDYMLIFEIECAFSGVRGKNLAFLIVPLDAEMEAVNDVDGEPLIASEVYRMEVNTGKGSVEVPVPFSFFPAGARTLRYTCIVVDDDSLDEMAEARSFEISINEVKQMVARKPIEKTMNLLDILLGDGGLLGGDDDEYDKYGNRLCKYCHGSKECSDCNGRGEKYGEKCLSCDGSGKCNYCGGRGAYW